MKKQLMLGLLSCAMCLGLSGCNKDEPKKEPTNDANEIVGVQGEDVNDDKGKYFYKTFNVKDFDASKFDGKIKLQNINAKNGENDKYAQYQTPITFEQLKKDSYYIDDDDFKNKADPDSWCEDFFLDYKDPNGYNGESFATKILVPSLTEGNLTYEQILNKGTYLFYFKDHFLDDVINVKDRKHHAREFDMLVDLLGAPSMVMGDAMSLDGDLSSGFFTYIYKYDTGALIFSGLEFTGKDNSGSFDEIYYASNEEALNKFIEYNKASGQNILAE